MTSLGVMTLEDVDNILIPQIDVPLKRKENSQVEIFDLNNPERPLVGKEIVNHTVGELIRVATEDFLKADPLMVNDSNAEEILFCYRETIWSHSSEWDESEMTEEEKNAARAAATGQSSSSSSSTAPTSGRTTRSTAAAMTEEPIGSSNSFMDDANLVRHGGDCGGDRELRVILVPNRYRVFHWKLSASNQQQFSSLLDAFVSQHVFFSTKDCCPNIDAFTSRSRMALDVFATKVSTMQDELKSLILMDMEKANKLPEEIKQVMRPKRIAAIPPSVAAVAMPTVVAQPLMPTDALDLGVESIGRWMKYVNDCISTKQPLKVSLWPEEITLRITNRIRSESMGMSQEQAEHWKAKEGNNLLDLLRTLLPRSHAQSTHKQVGKTPLEVFQDWATANPLKAHFEHDDIMDGWHQYIDSMSVYQLQWAKLQREGYRPTIDEERLLVKNLYKNFCTAGLEQNSRNLIRQQVEQACYSKRSLMIALDAASTVVLDKFRMCKNAFDFLPRKRSLGYQGSAKPGDKPGKGEKKVSRFKTTAQTPFTNNLEKPGICRGCGWTTKSNTRPGVISKTPAEYRCRRGEFKEGCGSDPRHNSSTQEWKESEVGKMWAAAGYESLPKDTTITLQNAKERRYDAKASSNSEKQKGMYTFMIDACKDLLLTRELIPFSLLNVQTARRNPNGFEDKPGRDDSAPTASMLLDTGAIGASVVSDSYLAILKNSNVSFKSSKICHELNSALNDSAISNQQICFNIYLTSENSHETEVIKVPIRAIVAPIGVDLIIDKATIKENNLVQHFPSHFAEGDTLEWLKQLPANKPSPNSEASITEQKIHVFSTSISSPKGSAWGTRLKRHQAQHHRAWIKMQREVFKEVCHGLDKTQASYLMTFSARLDELKKKHPNNDDLIRSTLANLTSNFSKKPAFEREGNLTGIPDNKLESIPAELVSGVHSVNDFKKVHIEGGPLVQTELARLVEEFKDIFRTSVQDKPANLKPFKLEVDKTKWELPANQLRCRKLDREREVELAKMIEILINANIIEACDAAHYSHAFLVPKPNGKWRLVLDFKNLNGATVNYYKWPLPDIREMLNRVGDSRPEFFAVFDLTSGYYQAEIDEDSREFTAFLTRNGVYRWLRLPMGLTGACSYFQKSLVTQVLRGLMHDGCELYLDDCMIHAPTLDVYLKRLRQVFLRFRENNITLNPLKCQLGLPKVEFVGHTIDKNGLHFTRDKLDSVLNFPRPETKRQIKSFIGLANYFRDHIQNHSIRAQPLQDFVNGYDKSQARQRIQWTPASIAAFEDLRAAIDECPMLWFMDDFSPIYLQTDASDYGIGAYLYQKITQEDGTIVERPIGFISKSIASEHQSWDTPMKEGFAIFYALQKWEYLLRDREFTILTDHQNLTRLRADHSTNKMVKRWFLVYQEYDIKEWKYVKGEDNMVPDQFSRLCPELEDVHPASLLCQLTGYEVPAEHWDTIAKFHNSGIKGTVPNADDNGTQMGCPGGHGGVERTLRQLDAAGLQWQHRKKHVRRFIKMCPCCQKMDQMKRVIHSYPFTLSTYGLWNTVSVDYIERLVPDEFGNNMIIVIIDR